MRSSLVRSEILKDCQDRFVNKTFKICDFIILMENTWINVNKITLVTAICIYIKLQLKILKLWLVRVFGELFYDFRINLQI